MLEEDAPDYHAVIQNPMDMATLLQRVDGGKYITCKAFLMDFDLILANAKVCFSVFKYACFNIYLPVCYIFF